MPDSRSTSDGAAKAVESESPAGGVSLGSIDDPSGTGSSKGSSAGGEKQTAKIPSEESLATEAPSTKEAVGADRTNAEAPLRSGFTPDYERTWYAGYSADDPDRAVDRLGVQEEVNELCSVLASKQLKPPVCVGLFGNWGTGKSTFMRLMRERIELLAGQSKRNPDSKYCANVVQVWFNAWQYSDTDMWASLAAEVFRAVSPTQPTELQDDALKASQERAAAIGRLEQVDSRIQELEASLVGTAASRLKQGGDGARRLAEGVEQVSGARTALGRVMRLWQKLEPATRRRIGVAFIVTLMVAGALLAIALVILAARPQWVRASVAGLAAAAPWLVFGLRWLKPVADLIGDALELAGRRAERSQLQAAVRDAEVRQANAQWRLRTVRPGALPPHFAQDRAVAWSERQRPGILAEIRKDFKRLSDHYLPPEGLAQSPAVPWVFEEEELPQLDRIIVYVDDLDRIGDPTQVIGVLESLHLLLAFPLFVAVVGVDSRWLLRSLQRYYRALAGSTDGDTHGAADDTFWGLTPQNYLEKIFQIPYTLPRMEQAGYANLVHGLIAEEGQTGADPVDADGQLRPAGEEAEEPIDLHPANLEISQKELKFLQHLQSFVETPRSTLRLVNLYRLVRAAVPAADLDRFVEEDHEAVAVMLAILIDSPSLAMRLFSAINDASEEPQEENFLPDLMRSLSPQRPEKSDDPPLTPWMEAELAQWEGLIHRVLVIAKDRSIPQNSGPYVRRVSSVARFSFEPERRLRYR
jgi:hypothetical protein